MRWSNRQASIDRLQLACQHVRNALADLSGQLGDYLLISRQTIAFNRARPYQLDVEDFERLLAAGMAGSGARALAQAVALYGGDLLAGLTLRDAPAFDEWLHAERQRLRGLAVHALELLLDRAARYCRECPGYRQGAGMMYGVR